MSLLAAKKKRLARQQKEAETQARLIAEAEEQKRLEAELAAPKGASADGEDNAKEKEAAKPEGNPFVYLDFAISSGYRTGDGEAQRVTFELFKEVPKTAENFRCLCTGERGNGKRSKLHYKGSPVHRVVPGFCFEGGDIEDGNGDGGESIYGDGFQDEGYTVKHDRAGIITSSKIEAGSVNGSQFMVLLAPAPQLDGKHCAFGKVVHGMEVLRAIAACGGDTKGMPIDIRTRRRSGKLIWGTKPCEPNCTIRVVDCGQCEPPEVEDTPAVMPPAPPPLSEHPSMQNEASGEQPSRHLDHEFTSGSSGTRVLSIMKKYFGRVIGKGGDTIRKIQNESGASHIQIDQKEGTCTI